MIKQYIYKLIALSLLLSLSIAAATVQAQQEISSEPQSGVSIQSNLIFGQEHSYSVFVKSNQESFVYARMVLTNPDESELASSSFTLTDATAYEMSLYQVVLPQDCAEYDYTERRQECVRYEDPKYTSDYSYFGNSFYSQGEEIEYYSIDFDESDGVYSYSLPKPVEAYKSTAVIAVYATKDYVDSSLGRYKFNFQTLAVDQRVTKSNVAVTAETDYRLKNPDNTSSYRDYGFSVGIDAATAESSFSNPDIDSLVYSIGGRGQLNKTFSNITPGDSSVVSGMFASNWVQLYMIEIVLTVLGIAGFFYLIFFLSKRYGKKSNVVIDNEEPELSDSENEVNKFTLLVPAYWVASFVSTALVAGFTILGSQEFVSQFFSFIDDGGPVVLVFASLAIILMYLFFIFGPAIYIGSKRKWKAGVVVVAMQFVWYAIAAVALATFAN